MIYIYGEKITGYSRIYFKKVVKIVFYFNSKFQIYRIDNTFHLFLNLKHIVCPKEQTDCDGS